MSNDAYSIPQLVGDLKLLCAAATDQKQLLSRVRPLALRAAASRASWLREWMYETDLEQGFGAHLLHEEPDHTLAVLAISWLPGRGVPPHDHGTWAVIAGVDGPEKNEFFERVDDRSRTGYAELRKVGEKICSPGDVVAMPQGMIHGVRNESRAVSLSLHIYGRHINFTERSQFDAEARTEAPLKLRMQG